MLEIVLGKRVTTLPGVARTYVDLAKADDKIKSMKHLGHSPVTDDFGEEVERLRSDYHQLLMDKLRENGIEFSDRFEAAQIAFDLVKKAGEEK